MTTKVFEFLDHDLGGLLNRGVEFKAAEIMCGNFDIFGPFLLLFSALLSAPARPPRAARRVLLGAHADRVLIGAWIPMV